jgi:hypothetical protein
MATRRPKTCGPKWHECWFILGVALKSGRTIDWKNLERWIRAKSPDNQWAAAVWAKRLLLIRLSLALKTHRSLGFSRLCLTLILRGGTLSTGEIPLH